MGSAFSHSHAASLAVQLPPTSRTAKKLNPENEWDDSTYLLSAIEYDLRVLIWQNTKDAQKNRNRPKPNETPSDFEKRRKRSEGFDKGFIDGVLGKEGDGGER